MVLDTNVYVSVFHFPGSALQPIWEEARDDRFQLLISPAIIREFAQVVRTRFGWSEEQIAKHVRLVTKTAEIVSPSFLPEAVPEDPADNHIVACGLAGKAHLIVSGDKDLLRLRKYEGIPIIRPVDFLRTLGRDHPH